jgi:small-conductance mechanosensitive channel
MTAIASILDFPVFRVGDTQTTLGSLLGAIGVLIVTLFLARLARRAAHRFFHRWHGEDVETSRIYRVVPQLIVWFIGLEVALHILGIHLTTLFAAGGFLALGAGFATKNDSLVRTPVFGARGFAA